MALLAAGCGGGDNATTSTTTDTGGTTTTTSETIAVKAYFLRGGKVWPVHREVENTEGLTAAALGVLLAGPTDQEASDLGASTDIADGTKLEDVSIVGGVATVKLSRDLSPKALAQVVYTATQFPGVRSVSLPCCAEALTVYTRKDFEELTPTILVESPLAFEEVTSPFRATGTANTFEATFQYEVTDPDGKIVDKNFVTATSGTGTRGTFDFTTKTFTVPFDGVGELIV